MKEKENDPEANLTLRCDDVISTETLPERGNWSRQIDFTFSVVGYSIGLGNLWRFPYLCMRNGGGAFLIPYFFALFMCGLPLFYLELVIGQFSSLGAFRVWDFAPLFRGLGYGMVAVSAIVAIYYNLIISWTLYFLGMSFTSELPWSSCNNTWNTEICQDGTLNKLTYTSNVTSINETWMLNVTEKSMEPRSPAEEFWQFNVLDLSSGIGDLAGIRWQLLLCLIASWIIIFLCLCKGVQSSGKVVYVTATVPYLFLTMLLVRGATLPGAVEGIIFFIKPDFNRLLKFKTWAEAFLQVFYSLGPAWGGPITMASYNRFNNNCARDALIVSVACSGTSLYAGFVIFSVIGFMAQELGQPVSEVITSGPGLAFIAYPEAITKLPISPLWAICFFLMLLTLGLDTQFGMVETVISAIVDQFPKLLRRRKPLVTAFVCCFALCLGLPFVTRAGMYIFQVVDWYVGAVSLMLIGCLECLVLSWIYGLERLYYDITLMHGHQPYRLWKLMWAVVTPCLLMVMLVYSCLVLAPPTYGDYTYPGWARALGILVAMISVIPLPGYAIYAISRETGSLKERIKVLIQPLPTWGPAKEPYRSQYKYASYKTVPPVENGPKTDEEVPRTEKSFLTW